jgi:hypothetical protein
MAMALPSGRMGVLIIVLMIESLVFSLAASNYGLDYDPGNFLCLNFDEFCTTVLDGLGCTTQSSVGCPNYPTVSNDIANFMGTCSCSDIALTVSVGADVTKEIMKNRVEGDMYWLLEPWDAGPPYAFPDSFASVCDLLLERIGCGEDDKTVDTSSNAYSCACGTGLVTESTDFVKAAITARLNNYNVETLFPVFSRPVYLSLPVSIAVILIAGKIFAIIAVYLSLPAIVGFICAGVMLQNYLDPAFVDIGSTEIKKTALLLVLMRAGLSIKVKEVRRTLLASSVLSSLPYLFEFCAFLFLGRAISTALGGTNGVFAGWSLTEMGLLASVMAPLGPSVVVTQALQAIAMKGRKIGFAPKVSLITAPLEAVLAIFMFDVFSKQVEESSDYMLYPWVDSQPLWATVVLVPVNILFSVVLGLIVGYCVSHYIDWRSQLRTDFLWVRLNRNLQMGSNTADLVFVLLVSCYTVMSLCVPRYIQHCTGILAVFTMCITLKFFVKDIQIVANIAEGLRAIWIFAEVFLCTLLGASFAFQNRNGPLSGQRGLSSEDIKQVTLVMLIGTLARLVGVFFSVCVVMYPSLPEHRKQWRYLWRYCLTTWMLQLPRSTIQASLGPLVFSGHMIPGEDGQNKAFAVSQSAAFTVFVFAPLGALLSKHVGLGLAKSMTELDEMHDYNHTKFRYYSAETLQKRVRTPSQMEMLQHTPPGSKSPVDMMMTMSPRSWERRRSRSSPHLLHRQGRRYNNINDGDDGNDGSGNGHNRSNNQHQQRRGQRGGRYHQDHGGRPSSFSHSSHRSRDAHSQNYDNTRDSSSSSSKNNNSNSTTDVAGESKADAGFLLRESAMAGGQTPYASRARTVSKNISFSTEGKQLKPRDGDDDSDENGGHDRNGGGGGGGDDDRGDESGLAMGYLMSPALKTAMSPTQQSEFSDVFANDDDDEDGDDASHSRQRTRPVIMTAMSPEAGTTEGGGPMEASELELEVQGRVDRSSSSSSSSSSRHAERVHFQEASDHSGDEDRDAHDIPHGHSRDNNDFNSQQHSEDGSGEGPFETSSYGSADDYYDDDDCEEEEEDSDDAPLGGEGEEGEHVDYQELFRQSQLHDMSTLFDAVMRLRRAGRGLRLDTPSLFSPSTSLTGSATNATNANASSRATFFGAGERGGVGASLDTSVTAASTGEEGGLHFNQAPGSVPTSTQTAGGRRRSASQQHQYHHHHQYQSDYRAISTGAGGLFSADRNDRGDEYSGSGRGQQRQRRSRASSLSRT